MFAAGDPFTPLVSAPSFVPAVGETMAVETVSAREVVGLGTGVLVLFVPLVFSPLTRLKSVQISEGDTWHMQSEFYLRYE